VGEGVVTMTVPSAPEFNSGSIAVGFPEASRPEKPETFGGNTPEVTATGSTL